ncbi:MAG: siderophore ABC transporter substrate-binding protein [Eubacteriales bacterium]
MKKLIYLILAAAMTLSFAACGTSSDDGNDSKIDGETVTVSCLDGDGNTVSVEVPYDPQRIAVVDFASLDILDNLGLGDRIVGCVNVTLDYLSSYNSKEGVTNIGTIKEADMEALFLCEPDLIFMSGRMSDYYDSFKDIAPVVRLTSDSTLGLVESVRRNARIIASIFGLEDEVDAKLAVYDERIAALSEFAEGKTALVGMFSGGSFSTLGNDGRCSIIGTEVGFDNIGVSADTATATHGNEVSYEFVVASNPDYIFVMNRDAAIGADGADLAKDVIENELVKQTDAYKNGNIVYLANPGIWYTAEGGISALDIMLSDLESALLK